MGQRHQYWIIAKVSGRYRVLAAVHHQWAYGTLPIEACWRLLRILAHPENKRLARNEVAAAAGKDAEWWKNQEDRACKTSSVVEAVPFPFLSTCLVLATSFDPRVDPAVNYGSRVQYLGVGTSWSQVDSNDGFTIVDITDLDKLSYCFTQLDFWNKYNNSVEGRADTCSPMTDLEYLSYYPEFANVNRLSLESLGRHQR